MIRKTFAALMMATAIGTGTLLVPLTPAAAFVVFDPSNFSQAVLQAARMVEQINNQIQSLQNQAIMLQNQAKQLQRLDYSSLNEITGALQRIDALMHQAEGIAFKVSELDAAFQEKFPDQYDAAMTTNKALQNASTLWRDTMSAFRRTMTIQAQVVENVEADRALLARLVSQSQGAEGSLEAQQAANQLIALSAKQQLQIQSLLASQYRAEALDRARNAQAEDAAKAATNRFLGTGKAYAPD